MDSKGPARRRDHDAVTRFLRYLEEIEQAVLHREALRLTALLRKRTATHLPREVREELLMLSREPRGSLRAPVSFLRFQHRMTQLAAGGEGLPMAQTELQLEPPATAGEIRRRARDQRREAASDPVCASRDSDRSGDATP